MPTKDDDRSKLILSFMCSGEIDKKLESFGEEIGMNKSQLIRFILKEFCKQPKENYKELITKNY